VPITTDARIKFKQTIQLSGPSAIVSVEVFGGPIVAMQVAVFDAQNKVIDGVGFNGSEPITSEADGTANWLFTPSPKAAYIKWGVLALRSAANLGSYSVTGKVRDENGDTLVAGRYAGTIPDGQLNDTVVYDGVMLATPKLGGVPEGASA